VPPADEGGGGGRRRGVRKEEEEGLQIMHLLAWKVELWIFLPCKSCLDHTRSLNNKVHSWLRFGRTLCPSTHGGAHWKAYGMYFQANGNSVGRHFSTLVGTDQQL
jgi:hypothetical protein